MKENSFKGLNIDCIQYLNNILFVFVFGHNSESEYYSYSYLAKYYCTNIIHIRLRSFWKHKYYSYSVKILIPNNIRIRIWSKKQYSLTSELICNSYRFSQHRCHVYKPITNTNLPIWAEIQTKISKFISMKFCSIKRRNYWTFCKMLSLCGQVD